MPLPPRTTALVTGAGRGIGRATALRLARQGMNVVVAGRHEGHLQAVAGEIEALGMLGHPLIGDMRDESFWTALSAVPRQIGAGIDVLVHNASQPAPYTELEEVCLDDLRATLDTVLLSGLRLSRALLPHMKASGHGRIVLVGSVAWRLGAHGQVAYGAAKSGLQGLVRSLALEASRFGITCNLVEPGFIDTERTREAVAEPVRQALSARAAIGRAGTPEEVAAVIAFLASPLASYVTGACIPVSGGIELGLMPARPSRHPSPGSPSP